MFILQNWNAVSLQTSFPRPQVLMASVQLCVFMNMTTLRTSQKMNQVTWVWSLAFLFFLSIGNYQVDSDFTPEGLKIQSKMILSSRREQKSRSLHSCYVGDSSMLPALRLTLSKGTGVVGESLEYLP